MTPEEIEAVAGKLTKAGRSYLCERAEWRKPKVWAQERWMTFPPSNTHSVLMRLGLVDRHGIILGPGLALRSHLEGTQP